MKYRHVMPSGAQTGRSPCGERGLKYLASWSNHYSPRRSPCGERGLKLSMGFTKSMIDSRSPCGERGLKFLLLRRVTLAALVAPRAGSVG